MLNAQKTVGNTDRLSINRHLRLVTALSASRKTLHNGRHKHDVCAVAPKPDTMSGNNGQQAQSLAVMRVPSI